VLLLPGVAKASAVDSLRAVTEQRPVDSLVLDAHVELARSYFGTDLDSVYAIGDRTRQLARNQGRLDFEAQGENNMGIARLFQGNNAGALTHFQRVLDIREAEGDQELIGGALNNVALAHQELGHTALALDFHIRSLRIKESLGDSSRIRVSYNNIGLIYEQLQDYPTARDYYRNSLSFLPLEKDTASHATTLYNIGVTYFKEGQSDSARLIFDQSYPLTLHSGDRRMIGLHKMYYGVIRQEAGEYGPARDSIEAALAIFEDLGKQDQMAAARTYLGFNALSTGRPAEARRLCESGLELARLTENLTKQVDCMECLHESYAALGMPGPAYETALTFFRLRDSLASVDVHKQIVRKDLEYTFRKEQMADSMATARTNELVRIRYESELDRQQSFSFFMVIVGVLLLGLAILFYINFRNKQRLNQRLEVRVAERTKELQQQKDRLAEYAFMNAHLLRQPLAQVLGMVTLLRLAKTQDELEHYLDLLEDSSERLDKVIHEIRDVVEAESLPIDRPVPVKEASSSSL